MAKYKLAGDVDRLADEHLAHLLAVRAGLMRHEHLAEHFRRAITRLQAGVSQRCTPPLKPILERALAAPAGMDLRLDDDFAATLISAATCSASSGVEATPPGWWRRQICEKFAGLGIREYSLTKEGWKLITCLGGGLPTEYCFFCTTRSRFCFLLSRRARTIRAPPHDPG